MKLLLIGVYHSTNDEYGTNDDVFLHELGTSIDAHSSYDKFLIAGDFNLQEHDTKLSNFLEEYHAKNLVKEPTCFKNPENPSCIDLFITNSSTSFMKTTTITTGLSDFHKLIVTVMRTTFPKSEPHHTPSQCRPSVQHCSLPCPFPRQSRPKVDTGSKYAVSTNQKRVFHRISHLDGRKKYNSTNDGVRCASSHFLSRW